MDGGLVHEGEIRIETLPAGGWRFLHPDGRHFEFIRCTPCDPNEDFGVAPNAAATRWRGNVSHAGGAVRTLVEAWLRKLRLRGWVRC